VRDSCRNVSQERTRSLAKRYQALCEPGGSKIATHGFRAEQGMSPAFDREFGPQSNCVRHHLIRSRALQRDSRNPGCNSRMGVAVEICDLQNFGFVNDAKECAQEQLLFCGVLERGSQGIDLITRGCLGKAQSGGGRSAAPHLNPLPTSGERRNRASRRNCSSLRKSG
jgi:hypothetical protein